MREGVKRLGIGLLALLASCSLVFGGLPTSESAPALGTMAPVFALPDTSGEERSLDDLIATANAGKPGHVLLVFYRGHW